MLNKARIAIFVLMVAAVSSAVYNWDFLEKKINHGAIDAYETVRSDPQANRAEYTHEEITNWVASCLGAVNVHELPENYGRVMATTVFTFYLSDNQKQIQRLMSPQENQVIAISKSIYEQRIYALTSLHSAQLIWEVMQWVIIIIGMITTILVTLSSTDFGGKESKYGTVLRFLSIVFPALGTAAAAVNAFYNPRDDVISSSNSLTSLSQLHDMVGVGVWKMACNPKPDSDAWRENEKNIAEWLKRYQDIFNVSDTAITTSSQIDRAGNSTSNSRNK